MWSRIRRKKKQFLFTQCILYLVCSLQSSKLCQFVSFVQSHVGPFYSQSRPHVTDICRISIESPNSSLSSQNCYVGFWIFNGGFQSYRIAFCDCKISPKSSIAIQWRIFENFPYLNRDQKICGNHDHSIHKYHDEINIV